MFGDTEPHEPDKFVAVRDPDFSGSRPAESFHLANGERRPVSFLTIRDPIGANMSKQLTPLNVPHLVHVASTRCSCSIR